MARDILSTTASSVFIERFFSGGPLIMTDRRNRLHDDLLYYYNLFKKTGLLKHVIDKILNFTEHIASENFEMIRDLDPKSRSRIELRNLENCHLVSIFFY